MRCKAWRSKSDTRRKGICIELTPGAHSANRIGAAAPAQAHVGALRGWGVVRAHGVAGVLFAARPLVAVAGYG